MPSAILILLILLAKKLVHFQDSFTKLHQSVGLAQFFLVLSFKSRLPRRFLQFLLSSPSKPKPTPLEKQRILGAQPNKGTLITSIATRLFFPSTPSTFVKPKRNSWQSLNERQTQTELSGCIIHCRSRFVRFVNLFCDVIPLKMVCFVVY